MRSELSLERIQNFIMSDTEELHVGDFNPSTYEHVLPEGAHDFNDYDSEYEEQHPELGFTDEQVEAEVAKLDPEDKKFYEEYHDFLDTYYRQHGKIIEMPDLIKLIMTGRYPEIPSTTKKEQDELRDKLLIETRKREMSQQAGLEEEPLRKIRRIVPERIGKIIDVTGDDDPDAPVIIKITPGVDPYAQLDLEEEELEYKVGDETASEIHPDFDDADDLSCITIDSLKHIDNDKVKEIWAGMAKIKHQEGEYNEQLAGIVDKMMPEVVYQSVQATPRPSTNVPMCADELLQELGSAELFKRVLAIGYMDWQGFEKNRRKRLGEKYKPNTIREVAAKFGISTSRLMDLRRGAAINREDTQRSKMLKLKRKKRQRARLLPDPMQLPLKNKPHPNHPPPRSKKKLQQKQNSRSFSGPPNIPKVNRPKS